MKPEASNIVACEQLFSEFLHEIKTPLAIIRSHLESEINDNQTLSHMVQTRLVQDVEEIVRINTLLNDMKLLLGIERSITQQLFSQESLLEVLLEVIERLEPIAQQNEQRLILRSEENVRIQMDRSKLLQLFYNLIENAMKYSPSHQSIEVVLDAKTRSVQIKDRGIGVPPTLHEKIFTPFFRAEQTNKEGTGLGLAVAQAIASMHHATIGVKSRKRGGSIFFVRFGDNG